MEGKQRSEQLKPETAAAPGSRRPEQDPGLKGGLRKKALEGVLLLVLADEVPKASRVNDPDGSSGSDVQKVPIAGDQHVCAAFDCGGHDPLVIGVALWNRRSRPRFSSYLLLPQKLVNLLDGPWR